MGEGGNGWREAVRFAGFTDGELRLFDCLLTDDRSRNAIGIVRRYADGLASSEELAAASSAAFDAAMEADAGEAANAAAWAVWEATIDVASDAAAEDSQSDEGRRSRLEGSNESDGEVCDEG